MDNLPRTFLMIIIAKSQKTSDVKQKQTFKNKIWEVVWCISVS